MTKVNDALIAARLYYLQDQTMDAIARELRTSRSTVSRLLSYARESGLVQIQVWSPADDSAVVEGIFAERFGVRAHVVPVPPHLSATEVLERVGMYASRVLAPMIESGAVVGISWGETLRVMSNYAVRKPTNSVRLVQLNGSLSSSGPGSAGQILRRFADAFDADIVEFPVPAFFDRATTKTALWQERSVRAVLDLQAEMSIAVFGVGSRGGNISSQVYDGAYLDAADLAQMDDDGVAGDVATRFFRRDGSREGIVLNERSTGPEFEVLCGARRRLCVAAGTAKAPGIEGALRAGLVTDLVIDDALARALVAQPVAASTALPNATPSAGSGPRLPAAP